MKLFTQLLMNKLKLIIKQLLYKISPFFNYYVSIPQKKKSLSKILIYSLVSNFSKLNVPLTLNEKRLLSFKSKYNSKRCFIIGNGPSLNKLNLKLLKNEITFGVNAIYENYDQMGFLPNFLVVEDRLVAEDRKDELIELNGVTKFFGNHLKYCLGKSNNAIWLNTVFMYDFDRIPVKFSKNAGSHLYVGGTVSYLCMQLAYFMGFDEIYLVGFDHNYVMLDSYENNGNVIKSLSEDLNHFNKSYFGPGKRWHDPMVDRMEQCYIVAKNMFDKKNIRIKNASAGGKLEVFERVDFESLF